jgi:propionyl-CoA carboxylase alpha chain
MISRLLIANRGEIAVRVARTAHRLGISTVGVYSEPDATALHTATVDLAVALGGATPAESYLRADAVIDAALRTGAEAVHPGYGFLAENAAFARAVGAAGLIWVGPTPEQIELLGDKIAAKEAAVAAGVPTTSATLVTPGDLPHDLDVLTGGRPALIKAAAGGGGRGMRIVRDPAELADAVAAAAREAESAFGDGTVFIEPFIERGRHIEVQILGDHHGAVVHFGERECSVQRRNQKVIEEAPSAGIDQATRGLLCDGALALARHVGYHNAGTVEFMVSDAPDGEPPTISFLEVNTRLQVEHPVTEAVTGVDLVELQLRVAAGEPLPFGQDDVRVEGHAIEVRLVAEDPAAGWLPSTGVVERFHIGGGVRVDSGVSAGSVVSADYDSLLAKVIAHGPARDEAAARLARSLRTADLAGVRTDADCLAAILGEEDFLAARTPTAYLAEHPGTEQARGPEGDDRVAQLLAAALRLEGEHRARDRTWAFAPSGWRNLRTQGQRRQWRDLALDEVHQLEYEVRAPGRARVLVGDWPLPDPDTGELAEDGRRVVDLRYGPDGVEIDGVRRGVEVADGEQAGVLHARSGAGRTSWELVALFADHDATEASGGPVSPLPGSVVSVHVSAGDEVADGDLLVVIEAMKMEHRITARAGATVTDVLVAPGDKVDAGTVLVLLESA